LIFSGVLLGVPASYTFLLISNGSLELSPALIWLPYFIVAGMLLQSLSYIAGFIQLFGLKTWTSTLSFFVPVGQWESIFDMQVASWVVFFLLMVGLVIVMAFCVMLDLDQEMDLHQLVEKMVL